MATKKDNEYHGREQRQSDCFEPRGAFFNSDASQPASDRITVQDEDEGK